MPIIRKKILEMVCFYCGKRAEKIYIDGIIQDPKTDTNSPFYGWIENYNIGGNIITENQECFCSVTCLVEAIKKHLSQYKHINK